MCWDQHIQRMGIRLFGGRRFVVAVESRVVPGENVDFSLKWPRIRILNEPMPHGIASHIFPFCAIAVAATKLGIPNVDLPYRLVFRAGP